MVNFDYNLLKVLSALLETQSTTASARRLLTSQPAISRSLRKLRELLGDDILVRNGTQMLLTPKAEAIKAQLPEIHEAIELLVAKTTKFEPAQVSQDLSIAMNSSISFWLAAPLAHYLADQAPLINLTIEDWSETTPNKIASGEIQFGINYFPMDLAKHLVQRKGGRDNFSIACRKDHPLAGKSINLKQLQTSNFAVHIIRNWNEKEQHISRLLKPFNVIPRIQLRTAHLNVILDVILERDLLFPCSTHLIQQLDDRYASIEIDSILPTLEGNFGYVYSIKYRNEALIQWLEQTTNLLMTSMGIKAD